MLRQILFTLLVVPVLLAACDARPAPESDTTSTTLPPAPIGWAFDAPATWDDRVTLEDSGSVPGTRSARTFIYTPRDSGTGRQPLLGIFVFDSAAWSAAAVGERVPGLDSLASAGGQVFAASVAPGNPFAEGSRDFRAFDSLRVALATVRKGFRVAS